MRVLPPEYMRANANRDERRRIFEEMARRREYDLERRGEHYENRVTNDAWSFFLAGCDRQSPVEEAGPWSSGVGEDGKAYLTSDDFAHDVVLSVSADFADRRQKHAYVEELARRLNRVSGLTEQPDGEIPYERVAPFYRGFFRLLHLINLPREDIRDKPLDVLLEHARLHLIRAGADQ